MTPAPGPLSQAEPIQLLNPRLFSVHLAPTAEGLLRIPPGYPDVPEGAVFLGYVYPWPLLTSLGNSSPPMGLSLVDLNPDTLLAHLDRPDPMRLIALVAMGRVSFRAIYMHMHWLLEEQRDMGAFDAAFVQAIFTEWHRWRTDDNAWLKRRVFKRLDQKNPDGHWRWRDFFQTSKRRPDVSWHEYVDVPVHRLLWPVFKRGQLLLPSQRLRKRDICPDEFFRDCVNPDHFEIAVPMTDRRALKPGQQFTQRGIFTKYMHEWTVNDVRVATHPATGEVMPLVHCPEGHIMPDGVQKSWRLWSDETSPWYRPNPGTTSKCARCYERYEAEVGRRVDGKLNKRSRGAKATNEMAREQKFLDFKKGGIESILAMGGKYTRDPNIPADYEPHDPDM